MSVKCVSIEWGLLRIRKKKGRMPLLNMRILFPQEVKQARLDELMSIQQGISGELSAEKVGRQMKVIIDRLEGEYYIGRTEFDSPEVDPEVLY